MQGKQMKNLKKHNRNISFNSNQEYPSAHHRSHSFSKYFYVNKSKMYKSKHKNNKALN
jgi:hypothetical protein